MGLGISFTGENSGFFAKKIKTDELVTVIKVLGRKYEYKFEHDLKQNSFFIEFCPTGFVELHLKDGNIEGESQTNVAGPGFHKAVVDFIIDLSTNLNLGFQVEDETSYWDERNFNKLQAEHLAWLTAVIENLTHYNETSFMISWAIGTWRPISEDNIITPMGTYKWESIKSIFEKGNKIDFATEYFIWYNSTKDAYYHRGVALYLMWNDFCWVPPRNDYEKNLANEILVHLELARKVDSNIKLPINEYREVAKLVDAHKSLGEPNFEFSSKIGYRRGDIIFSFPGGWEATLPGDFIIEAEEEGYVFWDEERNFRLSAYTLKSGSEDNFFDRYKSIDKNSPNTILYENDGYTYKGVYGYENEEDGTCYWLMQGQILGYNKTAVITITWQDEKWTEWAIDTFKKTINTSNKNI